MALPGKEARVRAPLVARMALAREEHAAEAIWRLMPRLSRDQFCQRMADLGDHPDGRIAQAYACFLLLRRMPPSREKAKQWEEMTARLRQALDDKGRDARPDAAEVDSCSKQSGEVLSR